MNKKPLLNPNTSGQGTDPDHAKHPLYPVVTSFGYVYSHSVNVGTYPEGRWTLYHCYRFPGTDHRVSLREVDKGDYREPSMGFHTKTTCASGHEHYGVGEKELRKHLKYKARRYGLNH